MKPRNIGGLLKSKAPVCYTFVAFSAAEGEWFEVSQAFCRDVVNAAKEDNVEDVVAKYDEKENALYIGYGIDPDLAPGADEEE